MAIEWLKSWVVRDAPRGGEGYRDGDGARKENHIKNYDIWNKWKKRLNKSRQSAWFQEGEIWWTSIGCNIGCEIDGKSDRFSRPVLIMKWVSKNSFIGMPLTGTTKDNPGHHQCENESGSIILEQIRFYSAQRLLEKKGEMQSDEFEKIINAFVKYILSQKQKRT